MDANTNGMKQFVKPAAENPNLPCLRAGKSKCFHAKMPVDGNKYNAQFSKKSLTRVS